MFYIKTQIRLLQSNHGEGPFLRPSQVCADHACSLMCVFAVSGGDDGTKQDMLLGDLEVSLDIIHLEFIVSLRRI